ncbi:MAG: NAD(P)-dependent alcohol dehydrogenase [Candidatus Dormibacteraeota bacterium]|uniref:NAD(P)-dependent alcohol dehydrogenase n=1 Tax=Candidatus Amunia macphersoniae TaxID=3127014 RepID=A0A934KPU0_9BACT|nr:NAD(P)-dependent alcohol dehydrogenase [Candidatus Dormibacteraeota bacterium]
MPTACWPTCTLAHTSRRRRVGWRNRERWRPPGWWTGTTRSLRNQRIRQEAARRRNDPTHGERRERSPHLPRSHPVLIRTHAYAAIGPGSPLQPFELDRRRPGSHDVLIDILFCGVCHSDIHQARDEWGGAVFPMVPGHEIIGRVASIGDEVRRWTVGDTVGVGVFVDSCRECEACVAGEEQYCERGMSPTYNGYARDGTTPNHGGYSERIVVDESYVLSMPPGITLDAAAPLLCAGITTYSPIRHFGVRAGEQAAVVGLGGLGHMAVKFLEALGTQVTVLSHSPAKREDAIRLGADDFVVTSEADWLASCDGRFDFIIDTVSATHDYNSYLRALRRDGTMVLVGLPGPSPLEAGPLVNGRRRLAGSMIGGIRETQEMLDFCAEHQIASDIEVIPIQQINDAYERTLRSDVRYRFVIDIESLRGPDRRVAGPVADTAAAR